MRTLGAKDIVEKRSKIKKDYVIYFKNPIKDETGCTIGSFQNGTYTKKEALEYAQKEYSQAEIEKFEWLA